MRILVVEDETKMATYLRQTFREERHAQKLIHTVPGLGVSSGSRPTRNWTLRSRLTVWSAVFCAVAVALRKHRVDSLDGRILASESGITFDLDLRLQAEEFVDARYFTQILLNLLRNAVKYNHPGGSVRVALDAQESAWVIGIAQTAPATLSCTSARPPPSVSIRSLWFSFFLQPQRHDGRGGEEPGKMPDTLQPAFRPSGGYGVAGGISRKR